MGGHNRVTNNQPICIIPARGGSKRLPRKNIAEVGGKPIICWTIEQAMESNLFDRIIVSTDDEEIADIAGKYSDVEVWGRSSELSSDISTVDQVCLDIFKRFLVRNIKLPTNFCCLYATAILRTAEDIKKGYQEILSENVDLVLSVTDYEQYPHQALRLENDGKVTIQWPDLLHMSRQERPHLVVDAGSIYWLNTESFIKNKNFYGKSIRGYTLPRERAIDVDTKNDLDILQFYWNKKGK